MSNFFDVIEEENPEISNIKPLHAVPNDPKEIHKWLLTLFEALQKQAIMRTSQQREYLAIYRGAQYTTKRSNSRSSERIYRQTKIDKFIINHLYDMVETKIAQMMQVKPAIDVLPTNDEFEDKNAAKGTKMLMDHLWYINDIDKILEDLHRYTRIFGEAFLFVEWDKDRGDLHPAYVEALRAGEEIEMLDEEGNPVVDEAGNKKLIQNPVFTGDVKYSMPAPWRVFLQRCSKFEDCEYAFRFATKHIEDLKKDYPSKAKDIKADEDSKAFDPDSMQDRMLEEECIVLEFWHKHTKHMPKGRYIKFTKTVILEDGDLPYSHGDLPFERLTDLDIPEQLNGTSRLELIKSIQNMHNNINTLIAKNIYLTGHAKWVMPRGACKIEQLGNDNTVIQYQGPVQPQMVQTQPNTPEVYNYREALKDDMGTIYGVHGVSRGTPPQGITAGVALQFLNEQESERASTDIVKHNSFIKRLAQKTLAVCGDFYMPDDGRMLRIVGKDNRHMIKYFDSASLQKDYDVRVQNGSALPESKAGRMQRIIELIQYKPDLLSPERLIELLDFGDTEKFTSLITEAVRSADSENEDLMSGKPVGEPEEWEDHMVHWRAHTKVIQKRSFKEETPPEIQEAMIAHITDTEFAMVEKAKENQLFQAKLAELALFPIFYREGFVPQSREQATAIVQGAANKGEPINDQIPAMEPAAFPEILQGEKTMSDEINVDMVDHEAGGESNLTFDEIESLTQEISDSEAIKEAVKLSDDKPEREPETAEAKRLDENLSDDERKDNLDAESDSDAKDELEKISEYKKIEGTFGDELLEVAADTSFKHKVAGEEVDVTLQELLNNYAGKVPYDKKFNELAQSRKEHETQVNQINDYISTFGSKLKNNDVMGALSYFAEFAGMSPLDFKAKLQESMFPRFEQFQNMNEEQRKALSLQEENEYLKSRQESEAERLAQQQSNAELERELRSVQETHGLEEADLVRLYDELAASYEGEVTPQLISEYYVNLQAYEKTESLLSEIDPDLVNSDSDVEAVAKQMIANPDIGLDEWKEIIQEAYGTPKKTKSNSKKISDKVRSSKQEEVATSKSPQQFSEITSFDEL